MFAAAMWWSRQGGRATATEGRRRRNAAPMSIVPDVAGRAMWDQSRRAWHGDLARDRHGSRTQISGYLIRSNFEEVRKSGRQTSSPDRFAPLRSRPAQAKGRARARRSAVEGCPGRPCALSGPGCEERHPARTPGHASSIGRPGPGHGRSRPRERSGPAEVDLQYAGILSPLDRRVGLRRSIRPASSRLATPTGLSLSRSCSRSACSSPCPRIIAVDCEAASGTERCCPPLLRSQRRQPDRRRHAADIDSQIDYHGTIKLRRAVSERSKSLYPEPVRQCPPRVDTPRMSRRSRTAGIQRRVPGTFVYLVNADDTVSVGPTSSASPMANGSRYRSGLAPAMTS